MSREGLVSMWIDEELRLSTSPYAQAAATCGSQTTPSPTFLALEVYLRPEIPIHERNLLVPWLKLQSLRSSKSVSVSCLLLTSCSSKTRRNFDAHCWILVRDQRQQSTLTLAIFFSPSALGAGFDSPCVVCIESSSSRAFISAFVEPGY